MARQAETMKNLPTGVASKNIQLAMDIMALGGGRRVDMQNPDEVKQRIRDYLQLCIDRDTSPMVQGLALALGVNRQRLWEISVDNEAAIKQFPLGTREAIKQIYAVLAYSWEKAMYDGSIRDIPGIFLGKNHFGYKNEVVYSFDNNPIGIGDADRERLEEKYNDLPDDI